MPKHPSASGVPHCVLWLGTEKRGQARPPFSNCGTIFIAFRATRSVLMLSQEGSKPEEAKETPAQITSYDFNESVWRRGSIRLAAQKNKPYGAARGVVGSLAEAKDMSAKNSPGYSN